MDDTKYENIKSGTNKSKWKTEKALSMQKSTIETFKRAGRVKVK